VMLCEIQTAWTTTPVSTTSAIGQNQVCSHGETPDSDGLNRFTEINNERAEVSRRHSDAKEDLECQVLRDVSQLEAPDENPASTAPKPERLCHPV
jgi:hypothetical protein